MEGFDIQILKELSEYRSKSTGPIRDILDETINKIKQNAYKNIDNKIKDLQYMKDAIDSI